MVTGGDGCHPPPRSICSRRGSQRALDLSGSNEYDHRLYRYCADVSDPIGQIACGIKTDTACWLRAPEWAPYSVLVLR